MFPVLVDVLPPVTELVGLYDVPGPFPANAIGEWSNVLTAAAIANAVFDAYGVRIMDLTITAENVFTALSASGRV